MPPTADAAGNPGMCPALESNQQTFSAQENSQPGLRFVFLFLMKPSQVALDTLVPPDLFSLDISEIDTL